EEVTMEDLGGAVVHSRKSGVAHFASENEDDALAGIRELLSFLPSNNMEDAPRLPTRGPADRGDESMRDIVPANPNTPYDMREIIQASVDDGYFSEVQENYAPSIVVGFGRFDGRSVGIVGNQPQQLAGCLDIDASIKAARFVRFCDAFNIPLVTFVDVPG